MDYKSLLEVGFFDDDDDDEILDNDFSMAVEEVRHESVCLHNYFLYKSILVFVNFRTID